MKRKQHSLTQFVGTGGDLPTIQPLAHYDSWPYRPPPLLDYWDYLTNNGCIVLYDYSSIYGVYVAIGTQASIVANACNSWVATSRHPSLFDDDKLPFSAIYAKPVAELQPLFSQVIALAEP